MIARYLLLLVLATSLLAGCRAPGPGSVSGQIKAIGADGAVKTLAGAQIILRGQRDTFTAVSNDPGESATGTAAYNYKLDKVPAGRYTMAVTPPADAGLQPESDITLEVKADELYPQSVLLLPTGIAKPRPLAPSELNAGETGYVNSQGQRVVYQGGGIDATDIMLMYLLWHNPPMYGYGAPPVIITGGYGSSTPTYRVDPPPTTSSTGGQTITQRAPSVPGQGSTRPSSAPSTGSAPTYRSPSNTGSGSTSGSTSGSSSSSSSSSSGGSTTTTTRPSTGTSSGSQGVTRPSGSTSSSPSRSSSGSSSGGRK
ncbi:MAG: hypothetical protein U0821_24335 [Chloroflexota bacterium]